MPVSVLLITSVLYLLSLARCISFLLILFYYHTLVPKSLVNETERSGNEIITIKTTERVVHIVVHLLFTTMQLSVVSSPLTVIMVQSRV